MSGSRSALEIYCRKGQIAVAAVQPVSFFGWRVDFPKAGGLSLDDAPGKPDS
jgi:hypothetical protein